MYDVTAIRADFPILSRQINGLPLVYLDNGASAQKPQVVIDAMTQSYSHDYANVHRGLHTLSTIATEAYEGVRGKIARFLNAPSEDEIVFTTGTTEAINLVSYAWAGPRLQAGDEIILSIMEHHANIVPWHFLRERQGVVLKWVDIDANGDLDPQAVLDAITPRTRAIIVNTPHNPSATVWSAEHMQSLAELLRGTDIVVIADEVYEHMVFDGALHQSVARFPELAQRSVVVSSFGKTYHVTGWKVGYAAAPAALMAEFRKVHQFNVFTVNTPMQHGLASFMADASRHLDLPAFYQRKRDLFRAGLAQTRFKLLPSTGSYFQCVDYSAISDQTEEAFCRWLTAEAGVAAIPVSAFYQGGFEQRLARFCFAKKDETLNLALERLARL